MSRSSLPHLGHLVTFSSGAWSPDTVSKIPTQLFRFSCVSVCRRIARSSSLLMSALLMRKISGMSANSVRQISSSNGWIREPAPLITYHTTWIEFSADRLWKKFRVSLMNISVFPCSSPRLS